MAVLVCIPTNSVRGFPFLHTLSSIIACRLLDSSHSDWRETVPCCGFDLHFSNNEWCWASFHVFVSHLYVFFGEMSVSFLWPNFWLGHLFFWNWATGVACIFLRLILCCFICYYFLPFWGLYFHLAYIFLCHKHAKNVKRQVWHVRNNQSIMQ